MGWKSERMTEMPAELSQEFKKETTVNIIECPVRENFPAFI